MNYPSNPLGPAVSSEPRMQPLRSSKPKRPKGMSGRQWVKLRKRLRKLPKGPDAA